jgi:hypothetical protein
LELFRKSAVDAIIGAAIAVVCLLLYVASASPLPGAWDTAEMQSVPYLLGIAHPTGFPLYTLLGYAFSHVMTAGTPAYRIDVFGAVLMSLALAMLYAVMRALSIPALCALPATLWLATTDIVWQHGSRSEVHNLAFLFSLGVLLATIVFVRTGQRRAFYAGAGAFAAGIATHPLAVLTVPALLVAMFLRRKDLDIRTLLTGALVAASGLTAYACLPLRSAYIVARGLDPTIGLSGLNGALFINYGDVRVPANFARYIAGEDFGAGGTLASIVDVTAWQGHIWTFLTWIDGSFGAYAIVAFVLGAAAMLRANRRLTAVIALFCLPVVPFIVAYTIEGDPDRYRFLPYAAVAIALGASGGSVLGARGQRWRLALIAFFLAVSCAVQFQAERWRFGHVDGGPAELTAWTATAVPPHAIIVTRWLDATALGYGAMVDGTLAGRVVVAGWWDDYLADYCQWSQRYPIYVMIDGKANGEFIRVAKRDASHTVYRFVPARGCRTSSLH